MTQNKDVKPSSQKKDTKDIKRTQVDVARVTIELQSPIHVGTGRGDDLVDQFFVTDANDLPAIPGSSIAGVLRSLWLTLAQPVMTDKEVFGHQAEGNNSHANSWASRVVVSWGHLHDSHDHPVPFRMSPELLQQDVLLRQARIPATRQHVRINHRGTAVHHGLFDEAIVHAGHRFTFELTLHGCDPQVMDTLLHLLDSDACRFGGKTRRGLGRFRIIRCQKRHFDLHNKTDFDAFSKLPPTIETTVPESLLPRFQPNASALHHNTVIAKLELKPRGFWMIGGGTPLDTDRFADQNHIPDLLPYREPRVVWNDQKQSHKATLDTNQPRVVIPASSIKGALRHRASFHAFVVGEIFADSANFDVWESLENNTLEEELVEELFGTVRKGKKKGNGTDTGSDDSESSDVQRAGRLIMDDLVLDESLLSPKEMDHVTLDRFTQGALHGHLFQEFAYWKHKGAAPYPLCLEIHIRNADQVSPQARVVLLRTLEDLAQGHLQIGAGSGRGHGWFEGRLTWSNPAWLTSQPRPQLPLQTPPQTEASAA